MTEFLVIGLTVAIAVVLVKARLSYRRLDELDRPAGADEWADVTIVRCKGDLRRINFEGGERTKWIVFVPEDARFEEAFARAMVVYAETRKLRAVGALLDHHCETTLQKILLPYARALSFAAGGPTRESFFEHLGSTRCLLIERIAYEKSRRSRDVPLSVLRAEKFGYGRMPGHVCALWREFGTDRIKRVYAVSILLSCWAPVLAMGIHDFPAAARWMSLFTVTPVSCLLLAPFVFLWPWYRGGELKGRWWVVLAPLAIYALLFVGLAVGPWHSRLDNQ